MGQHRQHSFHGQMLLGNKAATITAFLDPRAKKHTSPPAPLPGHLSFNGYKVLLRSREGMKLQEEVLWATQRGREARGDLLCPSVV